MKSSLRPEFVFLFLFLTTALLVASPFHPGEPQFQRNSGQAQAELSRNLKRPQLLAVTPARKTGISTSDKQATKTSQRRLTSSAIGTSSSGHLNVKQEFIGARHFDEVPERVSQTAYGGEYWVEQRVTSIVTRDDGSTYTRIDGRATLRRVKK